MVLCPLIYKRILHFVAFFHYLFYLAFEYLFTHVSVVNKLFANNLSGCSWVRFRSWLWVVLDLGWFNLGYIIIGSLRWPLVNLSFPPEVCSLDALGSLLWFIRCYWTRDVLDFMVLWRKVVSLYHHQISWAALMLLAALRSTIPHLRLVPGYSCPVEATRPLQNLVESYIMVWDIQLFLNTALSVLDHVEHA